jgi:hypothetical protein
VFKVNTENKRHGIQENSTGEKITSSTSTTVIGRFRNMQKLFIKERIHMIWHQWEGEASGERGRM